MVGFFRAILLGLVLICRVYLSAQVTFVVDQLPDRTPQGDTLFVAGSFNNWDPGDEAYRLHPREDGTYSLTVASLHPPFSYKFTRGDWQRGEGDGLGKPIGNREQSEGEGPMLLVSQVWGWEDLPSKQAIDTLYITLQEIPTNTPEDASIYVTGSFNSWQPGDDDYKIQRTQEGLWKVNIPLFRDTVEFKFTRGSWSTVEGRESGRARFNRLFVKGNREHPLEYLSIESWEDLSGTAINGYTVFWLMAAIQGLLIILAIATLERPMPTTNRILTLLLLLFSLALLTRVVVYDRDIFQWQPRLLLVPDMLYFLYAPLFVAYIGRLLRTEYTGPRWLGILAFLPFVIHLLLYLPLFSMDNETFIHQAVDQSLRGYFELAGAIALVYNLCYWIFAFRLIRAYELESENEFSSGSNLTFLYTVMLLKGVCLLLWLGTYGVGIYGWMTQTELTFITDRSTDALWIGLSLTVFLLGYFAIREPDIFRLPGRMEPTLPLIPEPQPIIEEVPMENKVDPILKERVDRLMNQEQLYLNPKLTLSELADHAHTNTHDLSRVINSGFGMNFNDFVNSFRVEAFKENVLLPTYRNHTFLAVAFMVGFNSKTAFNRSFKKLTGQTPGEFIREQEPDS